MGKKFLKYFLISLTAFLSVNYSLSQGKISFIIFGDYGRDGKYNQREVAEQMGIYGEKLKISFVITTGDNFYPDGVYTTEDEQWKTSFENIYTAPSLYKRWYVTLGNHDYRRNPKAEIDYTKKSERWYMPARYYSEIIKIDDTAAVLFLFIDTSPFVKSYYSGGHGDVAEQNSEKQLMWIDSTLSSAKTKWKLIVGHHPVITGGEHGNTKELIESLKPLLEKNKVNAYFCGHDHDMQHLKDEGVHYFVSGAGSATRTCKDTEYTLFQKGETSGFLAVTLSSAELEATFVDYQGNELYKTTINK